METLHPAAEKPPQKRKQNPLQFWYVAQGWLAGNAKITTIYIQQLSVHAYCFMKWAQLVGVGPGQGGGKSPFPSTCTTVHIIL